MQMRSLPQLCTIGRGGPQPGSPPNGAPQPDKYNNADSNYYYSDGDQFDPIDNYRYNSHSGYNNRDLHSRAVQSSYLPPLGSKSFKKMKKKKKRKKQSKLLGNNLLPMLIAMNSMSTNKPQPAAYSLDSQIAKMFHKQQSMLQNMASGEHVDHNYKKLMLRMRKLEHQIEEVLAPEDDRNPLLDMFFLQNVMMSQNSIQSQFNPQHDEKSKRLQGFMLAQMMKNMMNVRNNNEAFLRVKKVTFG